MQRVSFLFLVISLFVTASAQPFLREGARAPALTLPNAKNSVKFLAIGDTGTGKPPQLELARVMVDYHHVFPYEFVIMVGDNMYGGEKPKDYREKFEDPYRSLLDRDVKFYASLGNHDDADQRNYRLFNMDGKEYYRFKKGGVAFYALNSNYMDRRQFEWLEQELINDKTDWKIAFFHHPMYSSGKHGALEDFRAMVEPLFVRHGVDVVFAGHEHFYERIKPQRGIYHFITGAGAKLRKGDIDLRKGLTEKGFDTDLSFMLIEIIDDKMHFQVISRTGATVDSGVIQRREL